MNVYTFFLRYCKSALQAGEANIGLEKKEGSVSSFCSAPAANLDMQPQVAGYVNDFSETDFFTIFRMAGNALNVGFV